MNIGRRNWDGSGMGEVCRVDRQSMMLDSENIVERCYRMKSVLSIEYDSRSLSVPMALKRELHDVRPLACAPMVFTEDLQKECSTLADCQANARLTLPRYK